MLIADLITRPPTPAPWEEGDNLPWDDPAFSERMLAEHLSQEHHLASRTSEVIDRQVAWMHDQVLRGAISRILDLACGPGLYTSRLARRGHTCTGIDFGPASVRYARREAAREGLACTYLQADLREADFGEGYGLVMMVFGQFNVFRRDYARHILDKAHRALGPDGLLLLEPQRFETVRQAGHAGSSWSTCGEGGGLFSDRPHLYLTESFWHEEAAAATQRYFVVDAPTGEVTRHAMSTEAYTDEAFKVLLEAAGFQDVRFFPSLVGVEVDEIHQAANLVIVARKR
jgi:SAM-dependent methyltransferase